MQVDEDELRRGTCHTRTPTQRAPSCPPSHRCAVAQVQTRSADEPTTKKCLCTDCTCAHSYPCTPLQTADRKPLPRLVPGIDGSFVETAASPCTPPSCLHQERRNARAAAAAARRRRRAPFSISGVEPPSRTALLLKRVVHGPRPLQHTAASSRSLHGALAPPPAAAFLSCHLDLSTQW